MKYSFGLLLETTLRLWAMEIGLRILPLPSVLKWVGKGTPRLHQVAHPETLFRAVLGVERRLFGSNHCLRHCLVCFAMAPPGVQLRIGVTTKHPAFDAHAWLETPHGVLSSSTLAIPPETLFQIEKSRRDE